MADPERLIIDSWCRNALAWSRAVRTGTIRSRQEVTDAAIVAAVLDGSPKRVLDIGCGEGWLARRLAATGVEVVGIDAVPELVDQARRAGGADFRQLEYGDLVQLMETAPFDCAVCNFSLLGDASTRAVCRAIPGLLADGGRFIIQTLHCTDAPERTSDEGWRAGSWAGFGEAFTDPAPWYWRSPVAWRRLLRAHGLEPAIVDTPRYPDQTPASLLIVAHPGSAVRLPGREDRANRT